MAEHNKILSPETSPLVSIVVPVYWGQPYLSELLASLSNQTYRNIEIIISIGEGDKETKRSLPAETSSDPRFVIVDGPRGAAENWTNATKLAKGGFIKLICQDDLLYRDSIEKQVRVLEKHPEAVATFAKRDVIDSRGKIWIHRHGLGSLKSGIVAGDAAILTSYEKGTNILGEPLTALFRAKDLQAALPWSEDLPLFLDLEMYHRIIAGEKIFLSKDSIGAFRVSSASWSTRLWKTQLRQTTRWQKSYAATANIKKISYFRSVQGKYLATCKRICFYYFLKINGSFHKNKAQGEIK